MQHKLLITMPAQPPNLQQTDNHIPCKCQARLDDNGELAGVPASKKAKSAGQNGPKKKNPTKTQTEPKKTVPSKMVTMAPLAAKKKPSVESDSDDIRNANASGTNPQEPPAVVESSDDKEEVVEKT